MNILPEQPTTPTPEPSDGYDSNPIVAKAVEALHRNWFGDPTTLTRGIAERTLPHWRDAGQLTERERAAVLARFPDDPHDSDDQVDVIVDAVVADLIAFGGHDLDRAQAGRLLRLWKCYTVLCDDQRTAIMNRFPSAGDDPGPAGQAQPGGTWLSGPMATEPGQ